MISYMKNENYPKDLYLNQYITITHLIGKQFENIQYFHILRELNSLEDKLANKAITPTEGEIQLEGKRYDMEYVL